MNQSKYIYLLAGPSGSGKSSVARKITEWYGFKEVWSYTERPPRYERQEEENNDLQLSATFRFLQPHEGEWKI